MPIGMTYTVSKPSKSILDVDYQDIVNEILDEGSKAIVKGIPEGIRKKRQPDGRKQKENTAETREDKAARRVKPNIPLHNEGLFVDPKTYRIKKIRNGRSITIKAVRARLRKGGQDEPRDKVARHVQRMGYRFFGITKNADKLIDLIVKKSLRKGLKIKNFPRVKIKIGSR